MELRNIFFVDYDGTLAEKGNVEGALFNCFVRMMENPNYDVVFSSGRPAPYLQGIRAFTANVNTPFIIAENGSVLVVRENNRYHFERLVPLEERRVIFEVKEELRNIHEHNNIDFSVEYGKDYSITVHWGPSFGRTEFWEYFNKNAKTWVGAENLEKIKCVLTGDSIDIFGKSVSKEKGIQRVLEHYDPDAIGKLVYIGDSANDKEGAELIKSRGGIVLAPENVTSEFRPIVDMVGNGYALAGVIDALKKVL